jgi:hypothetical protein
MEQTREDFERILKILMDKLKHKLCLKYPNNIYVVQLSDSINADVVLLKGEIITVKIRTEHFIQAANKRYERQILEIPARSKEEIEFTELLERTLQTIPRLQESLGHLIEARGAKISRNKETNRLAIKKFSDEEHEKIDPPAAQDPIEKEIFFSSQFRFIAIHWKSGIIVREYGDTAKEAYNKARNKILQLLNDPEIYNRTEEGFVYIEPHQDYIQDLVTEAKVLNKEEILQLIQELKEKYLND